MLINLFQTCLSIYKVKADEYFNTPNSSLGIDTDLFYYQPSKKTNFIFWEPEREYNNNELYFALDMNSNLFEILLFSRELKEDPNSLIRRQKELDKLEDDIKKHPNHDLCIEILDKMDEIESTFSIKEKFEDFLCQKFSNYPDSDVKYLLEYDRVYSSNLYSNQVIFPTLKYHLEIFIREYFGLHQHQKRVLKEISLLKNNSTSTKSVICTDRLSCRIEMQADEYFKFYIGTLRIKELNFTTDIEKSILIVTKAGFIVTRKSYKLDENQKFIDCGMTPLVDQIFHYMKGEEHKDLEVSTKTIPVSKKKKSSGFRWYHGLYIIVCLLLFVLSTYFFLKIFYF